MINNHADFLVETLMKVNSLYIYNAASAQANYNHLHFYLTI